MEQATAEQAARYSSKPRSHRSSTEEEPRRNGGASSQRKERKADAAEHAGKPPKPADDRRWNFL